MTVLFKRWAEEISWYKIVKVNDDIIIIYLIQSYKCISKLCFSLWETTIHLRGDEIRSVIFFVSYPVIDAFLYMVENNSVSLRIAKEVL